MDSLVSNDLILVPNLLLELLSRDTGGIIISVRGSNSMSEIWDHIIWFLWCEIWDHGFTLGSLPVCNDKDMIHLLSTLLLCNMHPQYKAWIPAFLGLLNDRNWILVLHTSHVILIIMKNQMWITTCNYL